jgi:hypothetical protein
MPTSLSLSNSSNVFNYTKLNGQNYFTWTEDCRNALKAKGLWRIVSGAEPRPILPALPAPPAGGVVVPPDAATIAAREVIQEKMLDWDTRNDLAIAIISGGIEEVQRIHVRGEENSKEAWAKLKVVHETSQLGLVKYYLKQEIYNELKFEDGSSMQAHIDRVISAVQKLTELGRTVPDEEICEVLIMSLPKTPNWDTITLQLLATDNLTSTIVKAKLLTEGNRKRPSTLVPSNSSSTSSIPSTTTPERALPAFDDRGRSNNSRRGGGNRRGRGGNPGGNGRNGSNFNSGGNANRNNPNQRRDDRSNDVCNYCNNRGHWERDCNKKKRDIEAGRDSRPGNVNLAAAVEQTLQHRALATSLSPHSSTEWILDSGATSHIISDKSHFSKYTPFTIPATLRMGDNSVVDIKGFGDVPVSFQVGEFIQPATLHKVLHVPSITSNLFGRTGRNGSGFERELICAEVG